MAGCLRTISLIETLIGGVVLFLTTHVPLTEETGVVPYLRENFGCRDLVPVQASSDLARQRDIIETVANGGDGLSSPSRGKVNIPPPNKKTRSAYPGVPFCPSSVWRARVVFRRRSFLVR